MEGGHPMPNGIAVGDGVEGFPNIQVDSTHIVSLTH